MTTAAAKRPRRVRRRIGDLVVELTPEGITFRKLRCRRSVFVPYGEVIEAAIDREGYRRDEGLKPIERLGRLRERRQDQPRTLFEG